MATLRELELQCRGAQDIAEAWMENHDEVREVWRLEDVIGVFLECFAKFDYIQKYYEKFGSLPNSETEYHYFVNVLRIYQYGARQVSKVARQHTEYDVERLDELDGSIEALGVVITNNERSEPVQQALDVAKSSTEERDMTDEEEAEFQQALARPASSIEVFPVPDAR